MTSPTLSVSFVGTYGIFSVDDIPHPSPPVSRVASSSKRAVHVTAQGVQPLAGLCFNLS